jgi:Replication-relaxation
MSQADAAPSVIGGAKEGSARVSGACDLDLTDWTEDELHDPLAQALLGFHVEDGRVVAQDGRAGQSLPGSLKEANPSPYSEVPPWTPGQTLLPKNPMVIKDSNKHSPTRLSDEQLSCIYLSLTPRDLSILMALYRYRYLNVFQIQQLFFPSIRSCQIRLKQLHESGVIHRWKILEAGNFHRCPSTVLLSVRGARLVALHHDEDPKILMSRAEDAVYNSASMLHDLQANQLFIDLARASAAQSEEGLYHWVGEASCRRSMRERNDRFAPSAAPAPDGWGRYLTADGEIWFCLEWERGTASGRRQWDKVQSYCHYYTYFKDPELTNVLFVVPDDRRVERLRHMLWQATSPRRHRRTCTFWVASAESLWSAGPLAPLWLGPAPRRRSTARSYSSESARSLTQLQRRPRSRYPAGDCIAKQAWWERRQRGGEEA